MHIRNNWTATLAILMLTLMPSMIMADDHQSETYYGGRLGLSQSPDQFVGGIQAILGNTFGVGKFAPSVDFGFGDNLTVIAFNGDLYFPLGAQKESLSFFAAAGPTLAYYNHDVAGSDTEIGVSVSAGLTSPMGSSHLYSIEAKFGFGDIPEFKVLFGFML